MVVVPLVVAALHVQQCDATVFGYENDPHAGGDALFLGRPVSPTDVGIAHRTLPRRARVGILHPRTGRWIAARVVDRGPYGKRDHSGWFNDAPRFRRRNAGRGKQLEFLACVDLTPKAARLLRHNYGREPVLVVSAHHGGLRPSGRPREADQTGGANCEPGASAVCGVGLTSRTPSHKPVVSESLPAVGATTTHLATFGQALLGLMGQVARPDIMSE